MTMSEISRLLVTGGAGFIGSNFLHYFQREHFETELVCLDSLTYAGRKENFEGLSEDRFRFVQGDITKASDVRKAVAGCDAVVNFAAESHVDRSIEDASAFVRTNFEGVKVMLDCAREEGVEKFIQIGTDEVYGSVEQGSSAETDLLNPRNPYSAAKAAGDLLAISYHNTHSMNVCITRSSNNYGPRQFPEKLIPLFVTNLLRGKNVSVYGDGKNIRDWLHVEDNCKGIDAVLEKGKAGEIYNIGGGNELENIDLTHKILKELGKGKEMIDHVEDRLGHDLRYSLDCSKIEKLGWRPEKNFEEGLKETIQWYIDNEDWWKELVG